MSVDDAVYRIREKKQRELEDWCIGELKAGASAGKTQADVAAEVTADLGLLLKEKMVTVDQINQLNVFFRNHPRSEARAAQLEKKKKGRRSGDR